MNVGSQPVNDLRGGELNKAVAIEVMGWRWDDDWGCLIPPEQIAKPSEMWTERKEKLNADLRTYEVYRDPIPEHHIEGIVYNDNCTKVILPDYQGGMGEAWKVVDKVADSYHCAFSVTRLWPHDRHPKYAAQISSGIILAYESPPRSLVASDVSASVAVCVAALEAVRGQKI